MVSLAVMTWLKLLAVGVLGGAAWWLARRREFSVRRLWPYVWIVTGVVALLYAGYALWLHAHYGTHGHDLGIYDQAVWHLSRLEAPITTVRRGPIINLFGDHFDPILYVLAPAYTLWLTPAVLLVAQALLFSALVPLLFLLGTRWRLPPLPALVIAAGFALNPGVFLAVNFDFHDYAFAPVLFVAAMLTATARSWWWYWATIFGLLLIKEPLGIYVTLFGVMLLLRSAPFRGVDRRTLAHGLMTTVVGIGAFFLITRAIIPAFSPDQGFVYWRQYSAVGETPTALAANMFLHPIRTFGALVDDPIKRTTMKYLLATAGFVPLLNWAGWPLLVAAFGERFWSSAHGLWMMQFHYALVLVGIMGITTLDALRVMEQRLLRGISAGVAVVIVIMVSWVYTKLQPWQLLSDPSVAARPIATWNTALRSIPAADPVTAQDAFVPHLTNRQRIYQYPNVADARWIVLDPRAPSWPFTADGIRQEQVHWTADPAWALDIQAGELTIFRRR